MVTWDELILLLSAIYYIVTTIIILKVVDDNGDLYFPLVLFLFMPIVRWIPILIRN